MDKQVTLRSITEADKPFLSAVYASTRQEELAVLSWSETEKQAFLTLQFNAQDTYYHNQFDSAGFFIIEQEQKQIGRLYLDHREDEIRIIDIALMPAYRNQGIGTTFLTAILDEGQDTGLPVRIHVEFNNPALRLYRRLGFQKVAENGVYYLMEKMPNQQLGEK